jgi:hypothetical protein
VIHIHKIKKLICVLALLIFLYPAKASTLSLTIEFYKNDTARVKDYYFTTQNFATFLPYQASGEYLVRIFDKNNSLLFSENFNILFFIQIYGKTNIVTEETNSTIATFRLYLPSKSFFIKFYRREKEILSLNLSDFVCNRNNICEKERGEDEYLCPSECLMLAQKSICGNRICEAGETQENCCKDCGCPSGFNCIENKCVKVLSPIVYFIILLVISSLIVTIILLSKRKPSS